MDKKAGILVYLLPFLFHKMAIEREFDSSPHLKQQEKTMLYLLTLCSTNIPTVPKKKGLKQLPRSKTWVLSFLEVTGLYRTVKNGSTVSAAVVLVNNCWVRPAADCRYNPIKEAF